VGLTGLSQRLESNYPMEHHRIKKKTVLLFGEGGREKVFFRFLENTDKFKSMASTWRMNMDHASGGSCRDVLEKCIKFIKGISYDVVLCFIDTDKLILDFPNHDKFKKEKKDLEKIAKETKIKIIWQEKNHEEEIERASNGKIKGKGGMKRKLRLHRKLIQNSNFVKIVFNQLKSR